MCHFSLKTVCLHCFLYAPQGHGFRTSLTHYLHVLFRFITVRDAWEKDFKALGFSRFQSKLTCLHYVNLMGGRISWQEECAAKETMFLMDIAECTTWKHSFVFDSFLWPVGFTSFLCAGWKATGLFWRSVLDKFSLDWLAFYVIWRFWLFWWRNGLWEMFTLLIIYFIVTLVPMCQAVPQFKCFPWHLIQEEWE